MMLAAEKVLSYNMLSTCTVRLSTVSMGCCSYLSPLKTRSGRSANENMAYDTAGYHGDLVDKYDVMVSKVPVNRWPFSTADGNVEGAVYIVSYDFTPEQSSVPACQKAGRGGNHDG